MPKKRQPKVAPRNPAYTVDTLLKQIEDGNGELTGLLVRYDNKKKLKHGKSNKNASLMIHFCHALGWMAEFHRITEDYTTITIKLQ